ncbi:choice-of-anchor D domain-containing protein [Corallococcus carmarthensis]|uniref:Choice-of-anchor D domain-containing protein n=1 Tax=Corallococcus carmarthensis TaxID=2316728 RepID=A0A3A8JJU9_9BACT|nr:choice-of-anchor D domain-containing protein [Corallococcus carmarthensis]
MYLEDTSIDFGSQDACTPGQDQVVLRNPSTKTRKIHNVSISGGFTLIGLYDSAGTRCETLPCTVPQLPLGSTNQLDIRVRFTPGQPGNFQGKLTLYTDDPDAQILTVTLGGSGTGPLLVLGQSSVVFGAQKVNTPTTRTVTVINLGNQQFSQKPSATAPFSVPNANLTIPAGSSKTLDVTFNPNLGGDFTGILKLAPELSVCPTPPSAWLYGQGLSPAKLSLNRTTLAFSQTAVGASSAPEEITVTNTGDSLLTVDAMELVPLDAPFQVNPSGAFSLASNESKRLQLTFHPTATSVTQGTLTFDSNDTAAPSIKLSGTTTPSTPCLDIVPLSFDFGEQEIGNATSQKVTVRNTGTVALTVSPTVTDSNAFTVNPITAFTLAPGSAGRELFITFKPGATDTGDVHGQLTFGTSPATSCVTNVPLKGTARRTELEVNPTRLDFDPYAVGELPQLTRQVTLKNTSAWPVKVFPVPPETLAPYTLTGIPATGLTIAPGSTAPLTVTFAASTWGEAFPRTLQFQSDATESLPPIPITGRALAPELKLDNDTLVFPNAAPGGERLADVTLRNTGNQALFLSRITPDSDMYFQVVDFLPQTVQPNDSTTVKVRFRPQIFVGDLETRLRFFTTNDRQLPPVLVVKGNSNGPNAIFGVPAIDFGYGQVNQTQVDDKSLTLMNHSGASESLKVTSIRVLQSGSAFSVDPITSSEPELGPGSTRKPPFKVSFQPVEVGKQYQDTLEITYRGGTTGVVTVRTFPLLGRGADAELTAPEGDINFPATLLNATSGTSLLITNPGPVPVDIEFVTVEGAGGFIATVDGWPNTIIPKNGGSRRIDLVFNPTTSTGSFSATLRIKLKTSPALVYALERKLTGVAAIAKLEMSSNQLVFGEVPRLTSRSQFITLRNIGSARLTVSNVMAAGGPFTVKPAAAGKYFPIILEQNQFEQIEVTFRPETTLQADAVLRVLSDSDKATDLPINVSGRGTVPMVALPSGTPQFAPQAKDTEGPGKIVVVRNDGKADLVVDTVAVAGEFCLRPDPEPSPKPNDCPASLLGFTVKPGESHLFNVAAKPTDRGKRTSTLTIVSNAETTPNLVQLEVEGVGSVTLPSTVVDFSSVNFGSSEDRLLTVTNSSLTAASVSVVFDSGGSEFTAVDQSLDVPAGQSGQLKLRFRPLGTTAGPRSATARLNVKGAGQVPFTLQAVATSVRMEVTRKDGKTFDGSLDFGGTRVNTNSDFISLRLTHVAPGGSADAGTDGGSDSDKSLLTIQDISLDGEDAKAFILPDLKLPVSLVRGGILDVPLQFHPDAQRRFNAVLRITSDDSQAGITLVTLAGRGRTNQLSLSTPSLEFGARVAESSASAVRSVRITNESLQPLQVQGVEIIGVAENSEPSHFSIESAPTLPLALAAQESKDIFIKYVPRPDVTSKAALLVVTNDIESPDAQVSLSGRGLSTVFRALNRSLDFGTVRQSDTVTTKVVLTNDSTQELVLMQPKVEGPQATSFMVVSPNLGAEGRALPQGDSLTLELKYDTSVIGTAKATLVLGTKDQERAALVALSGVTVASYLTIEPMDLDLGWVDIGATSAPRTVTLTNQSASPARLSVVGNSNPAFQIDASALDAELAPGAQTTVGVTFRGEVGGPADGTLKLRLRGETTAEASLTLKGQARTLGGTGGGCACGTSGDGGAALALLLLLGLGLARQGRRERARSASTHSLPGH